MTAKYQALKGRIEQTLYDVERVVTRAEALLEKSQKTGDAGYLDGVALNVHGFYAGIERIFEDIARSLEQTVPEGAQWPQDLLLQMAAGMQALRPPVITPETRHGLDEYRGFRHVVRNVYTFQLRPQRLQELGLNLSDCYQRVALDLRKFCDFLIQMDEELAEQAEIPS
jgi:hypothetical protein